MNTPTSALLPAREVKTLAIEVFYKRWPGIDETTRLVLNFYGFYRFNRLKTVI